MWRRVGPLGVNFTAPLAASFPHAVSHIPEHVSGQVAEGNRERWLPFSPVHHYTQTAVVGWHGYAQFSHPSVGLLYNGLPIGQ